MNDFLKSAIHNFSRVATLLSREMSAEEIEDAVLFFAFGVERVCKAIVFDVNPAFVLESDGFDNCLRVVFRHKLTESGKVKIEREADKQANYNLLPFKPSMFRAAKFSCTVERNIGAFTKLSDFRGIVAHRSLSELDYEETSRFVLRLFYPTVSAFAADLKFSATECFGAREDTLKRISEEISKEDNVKERVEKLIREHAEKWAVRKENVELVAQAERATKAACSTHPKVGTNAVKSDCPACQNDGIFYVEEDWEVDERTGEGHLSSADVIKFECKFCELKLDDPEDFDYIDRNLPLIDDIDF